MPATRAKLSSVTAATMRPSMDSAAAASRSRPLIPSTFTRSPNLQFAWGPTPTRLSSGRSAPSLRSGPRDGHRGPTPTRLFSSAQRPRCARDLAVSPLRPLRMFDQELSDRQNVEVALQERPDCIVRRADDRLLVHVEAGVDQRRDARELV